MGRLALALAEPGSGLPEAVRELGGVLLDQIAGLNEKIRELDRQLHTGARQDEEARRLMTIPGIGSISAMAIQAFAPPMESFRRGRDFSAWLGLVPRQNSTGGKPRMLVAVALANRMARTAWALMTKKAVYREPAPAV